LVTFSALKKSGDKHTLFLESFDDVIIPVVPAASPMCQPVDMQRRCAEFTRDNPIGLPIIASQVEF